MGCQKDDTPDECKNMTNTDEIIDCVADYNSSSVYYSNELDVNKMDDIVLLSMEGYDKIGKKVRSDESSQNTLFMGLPSIIQFVLYRDLPNCLEVMAYSTSNEEK